jgi:hypothetical protein
LNPGTVYWMDGSDAKLLHTMRIMKIKVVK